MNTQGILDVDLNLIHEKTLPLVADLRGRTILITGGGGFFGLNLIEALLGLESAHSLGLQIHLLLRNPDGFKKKHPTLYSNPAIQLHAGDVLNRSLFADADFSSKFKCDFLFHFATVTDAGVLRSDPQHVFHVIRDGTENVFSAAQAFQASRVLYASSGAVYGTQSPAVPQLLEDTKPTTIINGNAYIDGKRAAEELASVFSKNHGIDVVTARAFALIGPYLPLHAHYAIGNFIADGLVGRPIRILGDGTALRSYLYSGDLVIWLLHLLLRGKNGGFYNVGAEKSYSIAEVAAVVQSEFPNSSIEILGKLPPGKIPDRYIPSTLKARNEFGLDEWTTLPEAIQRTVTRIRRNNTQD